MVNISQAVIEVTRKCNLQCQHCLRGDAINKNIKEEYIQEFIRVLALNDCCPSITFSGGEPTLNTKAILDTIKHIEQENMSLNSFYIATNGYKLDAEFVMACAKLYCLSDEKEMCTVELSNDQFHEEVGNIEFMEAFKFFRKKYEHDGYQHRQGGLIEQGRAQELGYCGRHLEDEPITYDTDFYLNVNGYIINGCNWSYANQNKHKICHVNDFEEWLNENESLLEN